MDEINNFIKHSTETKMHYKLLSTLQVTQILDFYIVYCVYYDKVTNSFNIH